MEEMEMEHKPTGICVSIEPNLVGRLRVYVALSGNSITSTGVAKRERMSLAKFFREAAEALEKEPKTTNPRKKKR